jgi:hypothetical protein
VTKLGGALVWRKCGGFHRAVILALGSAALMFSVAHAQMAPPTLSPQTIAMGAFYRGAHVRIQGAAPEACGVVVVIRGAEHDEFLNRKGRVGFIWLNADRIHVKQAPSVFLNFSSGDLSALLNRASLDEYELDETAVRKHIHCLCHCKCKLTGANTMQTCVRGMEPDPAYAELLRTGFLNLKENEGSYGQNPGAVRLASNSGVGTEYLLDFEWPRKAAPGEYAVEVYACRNRMVIAHSATTLQLVEVGFPAYVANLASDRPWVYGSGAVLIAMLAGFGIDALTAGLRRRKHGPPPSSGHAIAEKPPARPNAKPVEAVDKEVVHRD